MELETAARKKLQSVPSVAGYVQGRVWKFRLDEPVAETGRSAIVVKRGTGWAQPDTVQTSEYPLLTVELWADHSRGPDKEVLEANGEERAWALYRVVDAELHGIKGEVWGGRHGLLIISCARWAEGVLLTPHEPTEHAQCVSVQYAVHTVHGDWE